ncbi:gliding motility lipoprotein GldH [Tenacibaculum dicentrarchi]|nr:gliding motility lipoprotein GldH [Tenacibaculum dicentrarchi]MCD8413992.1 gliding motility lipoprotein GldH [Tenacibaculum dicentrarchi]MCD8419370.1 gliding motility lipoprotein GldH [Tenacibaculum dicentrarchi]MCD8433930.1 gliding motility lipoprotein GldH [Tenacibaculum dicentrarchi]MCD8436295.1 gliding motility lipoprotein GldH [Tenacibaculum dicentrarchi]
MKNSLVIFFLAVFVIISCDSKSVYDTYSTLPEGSWNKNNAIVFTFDIKDSIQKKNLFINLRNNEDYAYSNLFLITQLRFPDGELVVDTLEYDMTDVNGKFLGKGFSGVKENKLFYKENITFPTTGTHIFKVAQAMRKNGKIEGIKELKGITQVGFRIEKTQ